MRAVMSRSVPSYILRSSSTHGILKRSLKAGSSLGSVSPGDAGGRPCVLKHDNAKQCIAKEKILTIVSIITYLP